MSMETIFVIALLLAIIAAQQFFYLRHIHKLLDKLMSRSYTEYIKANKPYERPMVQSMSVPEDLGPLEEFSS